MLEASNAQTGKGDLVAREPVAQEMPETMPQPGGCIQNSGASDTRHMRITKVSIPTNPSESAALGCDLSHGSNVGTGLSGLVQALNFDLDALVGPSADGIIPSVLIGRLSGWAPQYNDTQVGQLVFRLFGESGQYAGGPFAIQQPESPVFQVSASIECDQISSGHGSFELGVPLSENAPLTPLTIDRAHLVGTVQSGSLSISRGSLNGYLTRASLGSIIRSLQASCVDESGGELCETLRASDVEALIDFVANIILGGFDTSLSGTETEACSGRYCNAISVCIGFEAETITL